MRSICLLSLVVLASAENRSDVDFPWPAWPWKVVTTPPPSSEGSFMQFKQGVAEGLGFEDVESCMTDANASLTDLWDAAHAYLNGGWYAKAKALAEIGRGVVDVIESLRPCSASIAQSEKYFQMVKGLRDPRFYSMHNAMTLMLNLAEDHSQLAAFAEKWSKADYNAAGKELTFVVLDVLGNPGIPDRTGTPATNLAIGFAESFTSNIVLPCFQDAAVEIPAVVGGVLEIMSGALAVGGLESLFHGIQFLVPTIQDCMADEPKIKALLHAAGDFLHPSELAKIYGANIWSGKLDITLDISSGVLDYKGGEWRRFGQDLGKICAKIFVPQDMLVVV